MSFAVYILLLCSVIPSYSMVICPGAISECPDDNTCCLMVDGKYGCCPLPNATCCSDETHCCPNGFSCDPTSETCYRRGEETSVLIKVLPITKELPDIVCPDGQSECPDGNTCCKLSSGQYGCCPLPKAVCCSDGVHCCPSGYTCDTSGGTCNRGLSVVPMIKKLPAKSVKGPRNVVCPDGHSECPYGNTCCKLSSGQYGCCPLPKAVCCSDGVHCCPNGYSCDVSAGTCSKGSSFIAMKRKLKSSRTEKKAIQKKWRDVDCPDGSKCLNYETCCQLISGRYGCCPLPKAVCCPDLQHCCPHGYHCHSYSQKCLMTANTMAWIPIHPSANNLSLTDDSEKCKDGSECSDAETCCKISKNKYACCPLPSAVCCADKMHCCPSGYTCDDQGHKCSRGASYVPMVAKNLSRNSLRFNSLPIKIHLTPTRSTVEDDKVRFVPRKSHECNCGPYKTCCQLQSKRQPYCCPMPNASCCPDGSHCCPHGFNCDSDKGCVKK